MTIAPATASDPPTQSIQSARAVARAWATVVEGTDSARRLPVDAEHGGPGDATRERSEILPMVARNAFVRSNRHAVTFGILVFLVGEGLNLLGFISGHLMTWSLGTLFSIAGVTVALLSVVSELKHLDSRIGDLHQASRPNVKSSSGVRVS